MPQPEGPRNPPRWLLPAPMLVASVLLYATWLLPWTRPIWDAADWAVYHALIGTIDWGRTWAEFWAFANHRIFDLAMFQAYAVLCLWFVFAAGREEAPRRAAALVSMLLLLLLFRFLIGSFVEAIDYRRRSPTHVLEDPVRLSEVLPDWRIKDSSSRSFPGDHALVACFVGLYFLRRTPRPFSWLAVVLAVPAMAPRVVAGAHWMTDLVFGGLLLAAAAWAAIDWTGVHGRIARPLEPLADWFLRAIQIHHKDRRRRRDGRGPARDDP